MVWYFCNSRDLTDNNRLLTYGWGFSSFPLTCYFIIIASVIPNGIFILIFLWKIFRRYYPPTPSRNSTSRCVHLFISMLVCSHAQYIYCYLFISLFYIIIGIIIAVLTVYVHCYVCKLIHSMCGNK